MKILIPIDDSQPSQKTLDWISKTFDGQKHEFYVLTVVPHSVPELPTMEYEVEDALKLIESVKEAASSKGFNLAKVEYIVGDPVDSICQYADEQQADLIILGSHGRSGWQKLLLGSISSGVFEQAKQQVFIYKNVEVKTPATV